MFKQISDATERSFLCKVLKEKECHNKILKLNPLYFGGFKAGKYACRITFYIIYISEVDSNKEQVDFSGICTLLEHVQLSTFTLYV